METGLDSKAIRAQLDEAKWKEAEEGFECRSVIVGKVSELLPSRSESFDLENYYLRIKSIPTDDNLWIDAVLREFHILGMDLNNGMNSCDFVAEECRYCE